MSNLKDLLFGKPFVNEFSWSKSRDAIFRECLRQYYYNYYGSWGGWRLDAPKDTREIYILKKLKNRYMWIGEVVHSCIERSLKNISQGIKPLPQDEIIKITMDMMRGDFVSSKRKVYRQNPKTHALFEHEYDIEISDQEWKEIASRVESCLRNFYNSALYKNLLDMPKEDWLEAEELSSFRLKGTKIFVMLDCFYRRAGEFFIIDWKTGKRDEWDSNIQLGCYALYAKAKHGMDFKKLNVIEFNLNDNNLYQLKLSESLVKGVKEYISGSISDMKKLLKSEEGNEVDLERCDKTSDFNKCQRCNFRKICITESINNE